MTSVNYNNKTMWSATEEGEQHDDSIGNDEDCLALGVVDTGVPLSAMITDMLGDATDLDAIFNDDEEDEASEPLPVQEALLFKPTPSMISQQHHQQKMQQQNSQQSDSALESILAQAMCVGTCPPIMSQTMFGSSLPSRMQQAPSFFPMPTYTEPTKYSVAKALPEALPKALPSSLEPAMRRVSAVSASTSASSSRRDSLPAVVASEDKLNDSSPSATPMKKIRRKRRFTQFFFPFSLHTMLDHIAEGKDPMMDHSQFISWLPSGNGFKIKSPKFFTQHTLPKYFDTLKYKSFVRQINIYGFQRKTEGVAKCDPTYGAYFHPCFVRGQPDLCWEMKRQKIKGTGNVKKATDKAEGGKDSSDSKNESAAAAAAAAAEVPEDHVKPNEAPSSPTMTPTTAKTVVGRAA